MCEFPELEICIRQTKLYIFPEYIYCSITQKSKLQLYYLFYKNILTVLEN